LPNCASCAGAGQAQVAESLGTSRPNVGHVEEIDVRLSTLERYVEATSMHSSPANQIPPDTSTLPFLRCDNQPAPYEARGVDAFGSIGGENAARHGL
jgi:hypothetical protein